jgi:hypothetical protein
MEVFISIGTKVEYDPVGISGRGLYIITIDKGESNEL